MSYKKKRKKAYFSSFDIELVGCLPIVLPSFLPSDQSNQCNSMNDIINIFPINSLYWGLRCMNTWAVSEFFLWMKLLLKWMNEMPIANFLFLQIPCIVEEFPISNQSINCVSNSISTNLRTGITQLPRRGML